MSITERKLYPKSERVRRSLQFKGNSSQSESQIPVQPTSQPETEFKTEDLYNKSWWTQEDQNKLESEGQKVLDESKQMLEERENRLKSIDLNKSRNNIYFNLAYDPKIGKIRNFNLAYDPKIRELNLDNPTFTPNTVRNWDYKHSELLPYYQSEENMYKDIFSDPENIESEESKTKSTLPNDKQTINPDTPDLNSEELKKQNLQTAEQLSKFGSTIGQSVYEAARLRNGRTNIPKGIETTNLVLDSIGKIGGNVGVLANSAKGILGGGLALVEAFRGKQGLTKEEEYSNRNQTRIENWNKIRESAGQNYGEYYQAYKNKTRGLDNPYSSGTYIARSGMKFHTTIKRIVSTNNMKQKEELFKQSSSTPSFKEGGIIEESKEIVISTLFPTSKFKSGGIIIEPLILKMQEGGKTSRTLEELIEYAKQQNPRFIERLSEQPRGIQFIDDNGNESRGNVYLEWGTDDKNNAIIYPRIQEMDDGKLQFLSRKDAWKRAIEKKNILIISPEEAKIFFEEDPEYGQAYKRGWPEMFKSNWDNDDSIIENLTTSYKKGGSFNLIPEGALHKNKHHLEVDNITKKGIPVVAEEEGGKLEQQAEIERDEIIFRLNVTKQLEEWYKKYYDSETKKSEKDELALKAGKLLVHEILNNTRDNTNLINTI